MWESISAVIPVYNSSKSLDELYNRLSSTLKLICHDYEIILVDDGSRDDSFSKMKDLHLLDKSVKVISLDGNYGQQNAIKCGFEFANGEYIITLDDDLQHKPEDIERLIKKLDEGYDIVYGIALKKQHSFFRNIGSKLTNYLFNKICNKPKDIKVSSFRAIKRDVLEKIKEDKTSFVYITAITFKITKNIGNLYINHEARKYGTSKYSLKKLVLLFLKLYIYYSDTNVFKYFIKDKDQFRIKEMMVGREKLL